MQKINSTLKKSNYWKLAGLGIAILGIGYIIVFSFVIKNKETIKNIFKDKNIQFQTTGLETNTTIQNKICKGNICFEIEYATTPQERQKGLMFRDKIGELSGMLFVFEKPGNNKFWMKNTLINLDILRLDGNYKIIYIEKNTSPCEKVLSEKNTCPVYGPEKNSSYVLEINGGLSDKYGIKIGDTFTHN